LPELIHLKLTIAYDGTGLVGWQRQAAGVSVQGLLEEALATLDGAPVAVAGAGRTDAGVHAWGQVASATLRRAIRPASVVKAANMRLPPAVRVIAAEEVGPEFHARFRSVAKTYRYRVWNSEVLSPFERPYVWHVPWPPLDVQAMSDAAGRVVGRHDFAAFRGAGTDVETTVRTIFSSAIGAASASPHERLITYDVRGDGFLKHMVRALVGTLVDVGRGRRPASWVDEVIASGERGQAGRTAPPSGLFLVGVEYE
jgi:tRNA pseudouridine38-40 synthase